MEFTTTAQPPRSSRSAPTKPMPRETRRRSQCVFSAYLAMNFCNPGGFSISSVAASVIICSFAE
jgi:hypothetical protein